GADERSARQRPAAAAGAEPADAVVHLAGGAVPAPGRRVRPHAEWEQQSLLPGQPDLLGGLGPGAEESGAVALHADADRPAQAALRPDAGAVRQPRQLARHEGRRPRLDRPEARARLPAARLARQGGPVRPLQRALGVAKILFATVPRSVAMAAF